MSEPKNKLLEAVTDAMLFVRVDPDRAKRMLKDAVAHAEQREKLIEAVVGAARAAASEFRAVENAQRQLLVRGKNIKQASDNWDSATLGQCMDFGPLMAALAALDEFDAAMVTERGGGNNASRKP